jgi:hypothetical protein
MFGLLSISHTGSPVRRAEKNQIFIRTSALTHSLAASIDAKRDLYKAIVNNLEPLGIPKDHVKILPREIQKENWGICGGQAGCDVELGFKVEV